VSAEWNTSELVAIATTMRAFEKRCDEILTLLADKRYLSQEERAEVQTLYQSLKEDLKRAAKKRSLTGDVMTRAESAFYDPAVRAAANDLRPATNSNPITSHWFGAVYEARTEFSYHLHNMKDLLPKE
jgi:hypothetical protein